MEKNWQGRALDKARCYDGRHRLIAKSWSDFDDPALCHFLHRVADRRLPRLFGRSGNWEGISQPPELPVWESAVLDLDPVLLGRPLLLFEDLAGRSLDRLPDFDQQAAKRLHDDISRLLESLTQLAGQAVLHLDIKPGNLLLSEDGSYALIDWETGRIGTSLAAERRGTRGYAVAGRTADPLSADAHALARTVLSLLANKPAAELRPRDEKRILNRLSPAFAETLQKALHPPGREEVQLPRSLRRTLASGRRKGENVTLVVIPDDLKGSARNIRIILDE